MKYKNRKDRKTPVKRNINKTKNRNRNFNNNNQSYNNSYNNSNKKKEFYLNAIKIMTRNILIIKNSKKFNFKRPALKNKNK